MLHYSLPWLVLCMQHEFDSSACEKIRRLLVTTKYLLLLLSTTIYNYVFTISYDLLYNYLLLLLMFINDLLLLSTHQRDYLTTTST